MPGDDPFECGAVEQAKVVGEDLEGSLAGRELMVQVLEMLDGRLSRQNVDCPKGVRDWRHKKS